MIEMTFFDQAVRVSVWNPQRRYRIQEDSTLSYDPVNGIIILHDDEQEGMNMWRHS